MTLGTTTKADVLEQVTKAWSPIMTKTLKENTLLVGLTDKTYSGSISQYGDTVYVSQIKDLTGQLLDISAGEGDSFTSEKLETQRIAVVADKRAVASVKVAELSDIQSQIGQAKSEIRQKLFDAVERQMNDYAYSLLSPSASTPDHSLKKHHQASKPQNEFVPSQMRVAQPKTPQ